MNCRMACIPQISTELADLPSRSYDTLDRRHIMLLKSGQRDHRIVTCDANDRGEKRCQPAFGNERGDLGTEAAGPWSFVHDDAASGFFHGAQQGFLVVGLEGREIDNLGTDAFSIERLGSRQRLLHHRAPADQRDVPTFPENESDVERQGLAVVFNLAPRRAVDARRFQEHNRIGVADRGEQQAVSAFRRRWHDDAQTWNMGEHGLGALGVMFGSANAAPVRGTQNHRTAEPPLCAVAQPRGMVHQLIDAGININPMNWISPTGFKPCAAMPTQSPLIRSSASGVSNTRSGPKRCCSPTVARKTPPLTPTSSPNTTTLGSSSIARASAILTASTSVISGISLSPQVRGAAQHRPSAAWHRDDRTLSRGPAVSQPNSARPRRRFAVGTRRKAALRPSCSTRSGQREMISAARSAPPSSAPGPPRSDGSAPRRPRSYDRRAGR